MKASTHKPDGGSSPTQGLISQPTFMTGTAPSVPQTEPEQAAMAGLQELADFLLSPEFPRNFVDAQLAQALRARDILERRIHQKLVFPLIIKAVEAAGVADGRKEAKQIAAARTEVDFGGRTFSLERPLDVVTLRHAVLDGNAHYRDLHEQAIKDIETTHAEARLTAQSLIDEFLNLHDPSSLLSAMELWGRSRNAAGDRNGGMGYHAGMVHYFEYRTSVEKNKRFLGNRYSACSIQDFIDLSESFRPFLRGSPEEAAKQGHSYIAINDGGDKRRLFVRTKEVLLVAFQHSGQPCRLLSYIPNKPGWEKREDTQARIEKELSAAGIDTRFNRLGLKRSLESHYSN